MFPILSPPPPPQPLPPTLVRSRSVRKGKKKKQDNTKLTKPIKPALVTAILHRRELSESLPRYKASYIRAA